MQTTLLPFSDNTSIAAACDAALPWLRSDGVIIAPTDTVYGIMCRYDSARAIERLFEIKQRPRSKPIPILIGERAQLALVTRMPLPVDAEMLAQRFWPGPLTMVLPAREGLPEALTSGGSSVGIRMPDHPALCELMRRAGPLAATSANRSGQAETHTAQAASEQLRGLVPLILSDDATASRPKQPVPSTVVDLSASKPIILRPGPIADEVAAVLGQSDRPPC